MISIIVPIYKVEMYLEKCVDSLISQTYKDIEIILVDDGSPDACPQICDDYAKKDLRIRVIHQENGGVSSARNSGLQIAKGEYVGFVDPDDWVAQNMYESMILAIRKNGKIDMAICGYNYVKENGEIDRAYTEKACEILSHEQLMSRMSDLPPTVRHGVVNKLFKRSLIDSLRFNEDVHSSEDLLFLTEYVQKIDYAVFVHSPLYMNLIREGSATHGGLNASKIVKSFSIHEKMYKVTVDKYPKLRNHALAFLMDILVLKYKEISQQSDEKDLIRFARSFVKKYAIKAVFNREIYWKTRIYYLLMR